MDERGFKPGRDDPISKEGEIGNDKSLKKETDPWKSLLYDYSQSTTFHGIPYVTSSTRWQIRRVLWGLLVITAITLFSYLLIARLIYLFTFPKSVDVEVTYEEELTFPAVTICNQNLFRLSAVQELGLYDEMIQKVKAVRNSPSTSTAPMTDTCYDRYRLEQTLYLSSTFLPDTITYHHYVEMTLSGCEYLCQTLHDVTCWVIVYMPLTRSCFLQPQGDIPVINNHDDYVPAGIYHRERCLEGYPIVCDYENGDCELPESTDVGENWRRVKAELVTGINTDHTIDSSDGYFAYMPVTGRLLSATARYYTPYRNTTGYCLELNVILRGPAYLSVMTRRADYMLSEITRATGESETWRRVFVELPPDGNQVIIDGHVADNSISGVILDDIILWPCAQFEAECKRSMKGDEYMGTVNETLSGSACMPWDSVPGYQITMPMGSSTDNNYCRSPAIEAPDTDEPLTLPPAPWCFNQAQVMEMCDVPFCKCSEGYFTCNSGLCIPEILTCDGTDHCSDGSDEATVCVDQVKITCEFASDFLCGYETTPIISEYLMAPMWFRSNDNHMRVFFDISTIVVGARAWLATPPMSHLGAACLMFDYIVEGGEESQAYPTSLEVYLNASFPFMGVRLWSSGSNGDGRVEIPHVSWTSDPYYFVFVATVGTTGSVFTLDNVLWVAGECDNQPQIGTCTQGRIPCGSGECVDEHRKCDGVTDCRDGSDEIDCFLSGTCNSDGDFCGYQHTTNYASFQWMHLPNLAALAYFTVQWSQKYVADGSPVADTVTMQRAVRPAEVCGTDTSEVGAGTIISPNYPDYYDNEHDCNTTIDVPSAEFIYLYFDHLEIEYDELCSYDWIMVVDAMDHVILDRTCGSVPPEPILYHGHTLSVIFHSDYSVRLKGFEVNYAVFTDTLDFLAGVTFLGEEGGPAKPQAFLLSPPIDISMPSCLSFNYYTGEGTFLRLSIGDQELQDPLLIYGFPGETEWQTAHVPLQVASKKSLIWEVQSDLSIWQTSSDQLGMQYLEQYHAAIDKVSIILGDCDTTSVNESIECDFSQHMCGYKDVTNGTLAWTPVGGVLGALFSAGETRILPSLMSPQQSLSNNTCVMFQLACLPVYTRCTLVMAMHNSSGVVEEHSLNILTPNEQFYDGFNVLGEDEVWFSVTFTSGEDYAVISDVSITNGTCPSTTLPIIASPAACEISQTLEDQSGTIVSPLFPQPYANNLDCVYTFFLPTDMVIVLEFLTFGIEYDSECSYDWIKIVGDSERILLPAYCGSQPDDIFYNGTSLSIIFHSDYVVNGPGWEIAYTILDEDELLLPTECGPGLYILDENSTGSISSPGFPFKYGNNLNCTYELILPDTPTVSLLLSFESFSAEYGERCRYDWLMILGSDGEVVLDRICGDFLPEAILYSGSSLRIIFHSDNSIGTLGWKINYNLIIQDVECGEESYILGENSMGSISSPGFPYQYGNNLNCTYDLLLNNDSTSAFYLLFEGFNVEHGSTCQYDWLEIEGADREVILEKSCGDKLPGPILYSGASIHITFFSDSSETAKGWKINYNVIMQDDPLPSPDECGKELYALEVNSAGSVSSPGFPYQYGNDLNCTYNLLLESAATSTFSVFFEAFDVEYSASCSYDWLKVEGVDREIILAQSCGNNIPGPILYTGISMHIVFYTDSSVTGTGWKITYNVMEETSTRGAYNMTMPTTIENSSEATNISQFSVITMTTSSTYHEMSSMGSADVMTTSNDEITSASTPSPGPLLTSSSYLVENASSSPTSKTSFFMSTSSSEDMASSGNDVMDDVTSSSMSGGTSEVSAAQTSPIDDDSVSSDTTPGSIYPTTSSLEGSESSSTMDADDVTTESKYNWSTLPTDGFADEFSANQTTQKQSVEDATTLQTSDGDADDILTTEADTSSLDFGAEQVLLQMATDQMDIASFYGYAGHRKEDLIYACYWDGAACDNSSITPIMTDMGQCYSFNYNTDRYNISKTGAGFGLQLILNIEQYEYLSGPNTDAGVKIYLHEQDDIAMVKNFGIAVAPGVHSLISAKYSKFTNLPPPYGTCGSVPLPLYANSSESDGTNQTVKYTHSRCTTECYTDYARTECHCRDAFMPGDVPLCDLDTYLECLLPIEYLTGFRGKDCVECPNACEVYSYGAEMSYGTLSSLSVQSLLTADSGRLSSGYHRALEIRERVITEYLEQTVIGLQNVTIQLQGFLWLSESYAQVVMEKVNDALLQLFILARDDINKVNTFIEDFQAVYETHMSVNVENLLYQAGDLLSSLSFLDTQASLQSPATLTHKLQHISEQIEEYAVIFETLNNNPRQLFYSTENDKLPSNVWGSITCSEGVHREIFSAMLSSLGHEVNQLLGRLRNSTNYTLTEQDYESIKPYENMTTYAMDFKDCLVVYRDDLTKALSGIEEIQVELERTETLYLTFDYEEVLATFSSWLSDLDLLERWLEYVLQEYSHNTITKIRMAELIDTQLVNTVTQITSIIRTKVTGYGVDDLKWKMRTINFELKSWYIDVLNLMSPLDVYFEDELFGNEARTLAIWRGPSVEFDLQDLLTFLYSAAETASAWPVSIDLTEFLSAGDAVRMVSEISTTYMAALQEELEDVTHQFEWFEKDLVDMLNRLVNNLQTYYETSQLDENFILSNFLMVDVYFSSLKIEQIEQLEAYGPMPFLSEIGGYMGLLIGASCLTLCEILDLFIYNMCLKVASSGRKQAPPKV